MSNGQADDFGTGMSVIPADAPCGAAVRGVQLDHPLAPDQVAAIRAAWLRHQVLVFPEQALTLEHLEQFAQSIGPYGVDPYFRSVPGHPHIAQIRRDAHETSSLFAESWHSDWSFLASPPACTVLYGNVIPPVGGDTLFANQYAAWDGLPASMRRTLAGLKGIHSARRGYSRQGAYGENDKGRSMAIRFDDSALATQLHPIARVHPETGRTALFVSPGYTIGIDGMPEDEGQALLGELFRHQAQDEYVYRHRWSAGMLVMWDNRAVVHAATGGYQGYDRVLHRITVGERAA